MKENNNTTCDPCERDFERSIEELVKEGKAPSHAERTEKEHEVKAAFSQQHPAEQSGKQCTSQHASENVHSGAEHGTQGQSEQTSGQHPAMDASSGGGSGMSSNGGQASGQHACMESSAMQSGDHAGLESPTGGSGERSGMDEEERKTHESSDAAVHAMAGSTSDLK